MDPTEAINLVEVVLRDLVRLVLGGTWTQSRRVDIETLEAKRREDAAKRRGTIVNDDLLAYTEFTQLQQIILDDWEKFSAALGKKKYIEAYFDRLNGFRNPAMHSRKLLEFERDLVNGIVGELRNLVVLYRSTLGPDRTYYPKIEQVVDSFGGHPGNSLSDPGVRLKVGDVIRFECRGLDPQGRTLTWTVTVLMRTEVLAQSEGSEALLEFSITEGMVGESLQVLVMLTSDGKYHRYGFYDDFCVFKYAVDPPME